MNDVDGRYDRNGDPIRDSLHADKCEQNTENDISKTGINTPIATCHKALLSLIAMATTTCNDNETTSDLLSTMYAAAEHYVSETSGKTENLLDLYVELKILKLAHMIQLTLRQASRDKEQTSTNFYAQIAQQLVALYHLVPDPYLNDLVEAARRATQKQTKSPIEASDIAEEHASLHQNTARAVQNIQEEILRATGKLTRRSDIIQLSFQSASNTRQANNRI